MTTTIANQIRNNKDNPFVDVVADHFDGLRKRSDEDIEPIEYYKQHLFFVTVMFKKGAVDLDGSPITIDDVAIGNRPTPLTEFNTLFQAMNRRMLGSNAARKKAYQPIAWIFIDYEKTRNGSGSEKENIHLHGLILVHPTKRDQYAKLAAMARTFKTSNMDSVLIEPFDPARVKPSLNGKYENDPLKRSISYASKGCRKHWSDDSGTHWDVFPAFRSPRRVSKTHKTLCGLVQEEITAEYKRAGASLKAGVRRKPMIHVHQDDTIGMLRNKLRLSGLEHRFDELMKAAETRSATPAI